MDMLLILIQGLMVIGLIAVGVHYKGMAIGLFGAVGVLAFVLTIGTTSELLAPTPRAIAFG